MTIRYYPCSYHCNGCEEGRQYPDRILEALESTIPENEVIKLGGKDRPFRNRYTIYLGNLETVVSAFDRRMMVHGSMESIEKIRDLVPAYCTEKGYKIQERPPDRIFDHVRIVVVGD